MWGAPLKPRQLLSNWAHKRLAEADKASSSACKVLFSLELSTLQDLLDCTVPNDLAAKL